MRKRNGCKMKGDSDGGDGHQIKQYRGAVEEEEEGTEKIC